jgi:membrane protease YdiL (CAAX protease family)
LLAIGWLSGTSANEPPVSWLRLVAGIGPIVAVAFLLHVEVSVNDRRRFWRRVVDYRPVRARWWLITALAAAGPGVAAWALSGSHESDGSSVGAVVSVVVFAAAASFAEEPGWRGYALDRLSDRPVRAAILISIGWAVWHLPLYAIEGTFQHGVGFGTGLFWKIQLALLPQTVLMIWILGSTAPSILPAVAFHALVNISGELLEYSTGQQAIRLAIWSIAAGAVVLTWLRQGHHQIESQSPSAVEGARPVVLPGVVAGVGGVEAEQVDESPFEQVLQLMTFRLGVVDHVFPPAGS